MTNYNGIKDNQWLSIGQAAALLGWQPQRLQYYLKTKKPPKHTIQGGRRLFDPSDLLNWKQALKDDRVERWKAKKP